MNEYLITRDDSDSLEHYGVKGMKWKKGRKTPTLEELERIRRQTGKYVSNSVEAVRDKAKKSANRINKASGKIAKAGKSRLSSAKKAVSAGKKKLSSLGGKKEIKKNPAASASKKTIKKVANKTKAAYGTLKIIDKAVKAYPAKHWVYDTTDADFDVKTKKKRYVSRASKRTYTHKSKESKMLYPFRLK